MYVYLSSPSPSCRREKLRRDDSEMERSLEQGQLEVEREEVEMRWMCENQRKRERTS